MRHATLLLLAALVAVPSSGLTGADLEDFLERIVSPDHEVRLAARLSAEEHGAAAIAPLARLMGHDDLNVRIAALAAMERIVHHAGRPGGVEERGEVCAELAKLAAPERPLDVRREAVFLLGLIAGDRSVPAVAALLGDADRHVAETARLALERIPGEAATAALLAALAKADEALAPSLIASLTKKRGEAVTDALLARAKGGAADVRIAALGALARRGEKSAVSAFDAALDDKLDSGRVLAEYLRLADVLGERVDADAASAIFRKAFTLATLDHQREHALVGACPEGSKRNVDLLLAALGDDAQRVRRRASRQLTMLEGDDVLATMQEAYRTSSREARIALLRVLAERDAERSAELVEAATQGADAALKITALDLSGKLASPDMESAYLEQAKSGPEVVRPTAVKGYLVLARKKLDDGQSAAAFDMYAGALDLAASSTEQRSQALAGIVATKQSRGFEVLARYYKDSALSLEAARGTIALAGAVDDASAAVPHLEAILAGRFPQDDVNAAVEALVKLGHDPQAELKKNGFVLNWMLTTPIQDPNGSGFERVYFPEERLAADQNMGFEEVHRLGPRRVRWRRYDVLSRDGRIDLAPFFRRTENVLCYAYVELESDADREVLFKLGSDDGIACWLGKERVHAAPQPRGLQVDQDTVKVTLRKGKNRVLLKITQGNGDWAFVMRVTAPDGAPIDTATLGG